MKGGSSVSRQSADSVSLPLRYASLFDGACDDGVLGAPSRSKSQDQCQSTAGHEAAALSAAAFALANC